MDASGGIAAMASIAAAPASKAKILPAGSKPSKLAPASTFAEEYHVIGSVGSKVPPCQLPMWCVIPNPDDIEVGVEILRRTVDKKVPPKRLLLGKRAWIMLGRRVDPKAAHVAGGPQPDIGLATPRASRIHALALRNWKGELFLMDLGSPNGTFLDGVQLPKHEAIRWNVGARACFADDKTEAFELRPAG